MLLKKILGVAIISLGALPLADLPAMAKTTLTGIDIKGGKGLNASKVSGHHLIGTIKVQNLDAQQVIVEATGDEEYLKNLIIEEDGGNLSISFKNEAALTQKDLQGTVIVRMPRAMPLDISLSKGTASIDDRQGETQFNVLGIGEIKASKVDGPLKAKILGTGNIEVINLLGSADCEVGGAGDIRILDGKSDDFKASVMGSGLVQFGGEAKDAKLEIMGLGKIHLAKATGKVEQNAEGRGEIKINEPIKAVAS